MAGSHDVIDLLNAPTEPAAPTAGKVRLYQTSGTVYAKTAAGVATALGGGGGGGMPMYAQEEEPSAAGPWWWFNPSTGELIFDDGLD